MEILNKTKEFENNKNEIKENKYFWGLDIIRILAMFFVVLVHSTTFYGFAETDISSISIFVAGMGRYLSFSCIPLFLILTGYLNSNKTPTVKYYLKLIKILVEFALSGLVVFFINKFCFNDTTSFWTVAKQIITLQYPAYSWYINMFVGLFLLVPFLNYLYKSIPEKQKWTFIISLILIFSNFQISSYWTIAYPLMYYFIGVFLKDKQFNIKKHILLILIVAIVVLQTLIVKLSLPIYIETHNNIGCIVLSVSIFLLFYNLKVSKNSSRSMKKVIPLRVIANASLSTFLISQIFEQQTALWFSKKNLTTFPQKLPYLAYLTPFKFIASVLCGLIISFISSMIYKLIMHLINKIKKSKKIENN